MAAIKSFTDISQSKVLAEFLPHESADMRWFLEEDYGIVQIKEGLQDWGGDCTIPCWSLASLLGVLPEGIIENYYAPNLQKENGKYSIAYGNDELLCISDNPIDACYEMIMRLNELKML